jgi:flagellar motor switch protein FliM
VTVGQDFLSQEEVDALLRGVTGETDEPQAPPPEASEGIRAYDLGNQERIVRGRMPTYELIHERFARNLRAGLLNFMHRSAEVSIGPVRAQKYSEFIRNLVVPTNLNLVHVRPFRGTALFVFDPNLVFLVVDNLFGGDGRFHTRAEGREFTPTEQRIIEGLLKVVFAEYEKAWAPVFGVKFEYLRSELNCQFANVATSSEIVLATTLSVEFGGSAADMHICIPYSMIEPIKEILYGSMQSDNATPDKQWITLLARQVQDAQVELVATLGSAEISLREILQMQTGDVIPVDIPHVIQATVDDVPVIACCYGVQGGQYALKVERFLAVDHLEPEPTKH